MTERIQEIVSYVFRDDWLLVLTHDEAPLEFVGVQIPVGNMHLGESLEDAAVRDLREKTGLIATGQRYVGSQPYDLRPGIDQISMRYYFKLTVDEVPSVPRWRAGEGGPAGAGVGAGADVGTSEGGVSDWTCWWLPVANAHVLTAGLGALLGSAYVDLS
ncbi:MAG: NUDIX domain-containing protein [Gulosibacter sp.]|uniref:NUDIX domain-containing protein n=1 Tax=Gulosibacter sp. TaxID=2817531 RepID=UPI003F8DF3C6